MTKYEMARVLGTRAPQIAMCGRVMVELEGETYHLKIATYEGAKAEEDTHYHEEVGSVGFGYCEAFLLRHRPGGSYW